MISVIIPVFNRPKMLLRAVESVLAQTLHDFELIVIDDGSDEDLSAAAHKVRSAGHQFVTIKHAGVAEARNTGLSIAAGEWIALLDSDDYWLDSKLARQMAYHRKNPQYSLSQTLEIWYRHGKRVNRRTIHEQPLGPAFASSLPLCCISSSSVLARRELFEEAGCYDTRLRVCEDYDLWLRVTARYEVGLVPEELVVKEGGHEDQLSRSESALDRYRLFALLKLLPNQRLSDANMALVRQEILHKAEILRAGAAKRGLASADIYHEISQNFSTINAHLAGNDLESLEKKLLLLLS